METIEDLILKEQEELNPFKLLGVEDWVLRSMNTRQLKSFLGDLKKALARVYHPDLYLDAAEKKRNEAYFKLFSSNLDRLLEDDSFFEEALEDFRSGNISRKYERAIAHKDKELARLGTEIQVVKKQLEEQGAYIQAFRNLVIDERNNALALSNSSGAFALSPGRKIAITFGYVHDHFYNFTYALGSVLENLGSLTEIDAAGLVAIEKYMAKNYFDFAQRASDVACAKAAREKGEQVAKRIVHEAEKNGWPLFNAEILDNFFKVPSNVKGEADRVHNILGSLPYSSMISYFRFNGLKLLEPGCQTFKPGQTPASAIQREFCFDNQDNEDYAKEHLRGIVPFLSPFVKAKVPALVKICKKNRKGPYSEYQLIVPVRVSYG
jgi:hypothetical protein